MLKGIQVLARCKRTVQLFAAVAALAACGGGGGGGGDAPASTFALQSAYANWVRNGSNDTYTVSGFCSGSVNLTRSASVPAVFKAINGFSVVRSGTSQFTGCSDPAFNLSGSDSSTGYFDADYAFIGSVSAGAYTEFATTRPTALPASVVIGSQGAIGTLTNYTDSTRATVQSTSVMSYSVEADTPASADSVVLNLTVKDYDVANRLILTSQDRYRLTRAGVLTSVSLNLVNDVGSFTYTRN
jgi:hypothetical protein